MMSIEEMMYILTFASILVIIIFGFKAFKSIFKFFWNIFKYVFLFIGAFLVGRAVRNRMNKREMERGYNDMELMREYEEFKEFKKRMGK